MNRCTGYRAHLALLGPDQLGALAVPDREREIPEWWGADLLDFHRFAEGSRTRMNDRHWQLKSTPPPIVALEKSAVIFGLVRAGAECRTQTEIPSTSMQGDSHA